MAVFDGSLATNTGIGQGLAYVLPQSRAEEYAAQLVRDESKQMADSAAEQLKRQQALQNSIGKQFAAQKLPAFWSPYNKIINDNNTAWQQKAVDYMSKTGKSPFTNPDLIDERNRNVEGVALQSKELGDKYGKIYSAAVADAGNKFTPESVKQVLDAETEIKNNPMAYLDGSKKLPELKTQPASFNDFAKLIDPVSVSSDNGALKTTRANRGSHIDQALNTIMSNPTKWGGMALEEFGLDLTKPTYPMVAKNGRKVYPTNTATVDAMADQILAGQNAQAELAQFGIDVADEFAKEKLVDAIKKQNQGLGKLLTQTADLADAKVDLKSERVYDAERNARERTRFGERNDDKQATFWQQATNDIIDEKPGSGEYLTGAIKSSIDKKGQRMEGKIQYDMNVNTGMRTITIPEIVKEKTVTTASSDEKGDPIKKTTIEVVKPEQKFTYNPKDREAAARKITDALNTYTDEKEPYRKQFTEAGKGKVENGRGADELKNKPQSLKGKTYGGIDKNGNPIWK